MNEQLLTQPLWFSLYPQKKGNQCLCMWIAIDFHVRSALDCVHQVTVNIRLLHQVGMVPFFLKLGVVSHTLH